MKIEIWSDIACPFCYIGKQNLDHALSSLSFKDLVRMEYKSFELDPGASPYDGKRYVEKLAPTFGGLKQAEQFTNQLTEKAKEVGLTFNLDTLKPTNTLNAHRLLKWANTKGKEAELNEKLLIAHFTDSEDVGDTDVLANIAESVGLDHEDALSVLANAKAYLDEVRADQNQARQFGISGVPFFIFNGKYVVSGAQPSESFTQVLEKVWAEESLPVEFELLSDESSDDGLCTDKGCTLPPPKKL